MKAVSKRYKNVKEFGLALGFSELDIELIRQKRKLIEKLVKARKRKGLSQAKLAELISSKQPAIARMESGQVSEVSMDFLMKAAIALGVSISIRPNKTAA